MSEKNTEYLEEIEEDLIEQIDTEDYYEDEEEPIEIVTIAPSKKTGTVVLAPGTISKQKIINDNKQIKDVLEKYKSKEATQSTEQNIIEVLNHDTDVRNSILIPKTSIQERFEHRKRVISLLKSKSPEIEMCESMTENPSKKSKYSNVYNTFDVVGGRKIYWNTERDLKKAKPHMLDTELLDIILENQVVADMKLNTMYKKLNDIMKTRYIDIITDDNNTSELTMDKPSTNNHHTKKIMEADLNFSQIPIRNNDEFESFESELKANIETVARFELMLESLGSPENFSDLIKRITSKLFTPNFMESLGWSQTGLGGLQLKETTIKECIYNVFARKYIGIQEESLNEKFSQHFRSFRVHRNKARTKQKRKITSDESSN